MSIVSNATTCYTWFSFAIKPAKYVIQCTLYSENAVSVQKCNATGVQLKLHKFLLPISSIVTKIKLERFVLEYNSFLYMVEMHNHFSPCFGGHCHPL